MLRDSADHDHDFVIHLIQRQNFVQSDRQWATVALSRSKQCLIRKRAITTERNNPMGSPANGLLIVMRL
jgi:hypothetical protein